MDPLNVGCAGCALTTRPHWYAYALVNDTQAMKIVFTPLFVSRVSSSVTLGRGCAGCALSQVRVGGVGRADRKETAGEELKQPSP